MTDVDEFITQWEHSGPFTPRADDTNNLIAEVKALRSIAVAAHRLACVAPYGDHSKQWHYLETALRTHEDAVRRALDTP
jgi:hypothetical protein